MLRRLLVILAFAACCAQPVAAAPANDVHHWVLVSDLHFDPFGSAKIVEKLAAAPVDRWREIFAAEQDQPFPAYGADTNFPLLESSIDAIKTTLPQPNAIVLSGDFLAHNFQARFAAALPNRPTADYDTFVDKTEAFVALEFRAAFPLATMLPAIGNNDGYCGDYQSTPGSPFLAHFAQAWNLPTSFSASGSYVAAVYGENLQFVVVNDIYGSSRYQNACGDSHADPGSDQLAWLAAQLRAVPSGQAAIVLAHVPPGVDTFATLHAKTPGVTMMLADRFNDGYVNSLEDPGNRVALVLSGHSHMNDFRVLVASQANYSVPLLIVPAISPIFGGNPSFQIANVDPKTPRLLDLLTYSLGNLASLAKNGSQLPNWRRELSFDSAYGANAVTADSLDALHSRMFSDDRIRREFDRYYDGGSAHAAVPEEQWHQYWCANVALTSVTYIACAMPQIQTQLPPQPTAPPTATPAPSPTASPSPTSKA